MQQFEISGLIEIGDDMVVAAILQEWLGPVAAKQRLANEEFVHHSDGTDIYVSNPVIDGTTRDEFVVHGKRQGDAATLGRFLEKLKDICAARQITLEISYWEIDEDGRDIGEEIEV